MTSTSTDAQLVAAYVAGDDDALADIYDRYADSIYDTATAMTSSRHDAADVLEDVFVIAAERITQLRRPDRLQPWLLAILRNEIYRRTDKRVGQIATDVSRRDHDATVPTDPDQREVVGDAEFGDLLRAAARYLDERDQIVLEYSIRQGIEGSDLADALGISAQQCHAMSQRMRQRTTRSLAAMCVARSGRDDCPELAAILTDWDGGLTDLVRHSVPRHIARCETCERLHRRTAPLRLFAAAPGALPTPELRDRVLAASGHGSWSSSYGFGASHGFPSVIKYAERRAAWRAIAIVALIAALATTVYVLVADSGSEPIDNLDSTAQLTTQPTT
jgi:RNA polymerase sigma factor (sigma-70 family)